MVLLDDAVARGEPQAGALARALGRKEWLEDVVEDVALHAGAGVRDGKDDPASGRDCGRGSARGWFHECVASLDHEPTAARHGVTGVDREIDEELFHLARICLDQRQVRVHHRGDFDVLAE